MNLMSIVQYFVLYLFIHIQIFWLVTFFENRKVLSRRPPAFSENGLPSVTVIIPCYNGAKALPRAVNSVLSVDYPPEKLNVFIVDDGSTDATYSEARKFSLRERVVVFQKHNGGKHSALNLGIKHAAAELIACLDADSVVHPQALRRIVRHFRDSEIMAVSPAILVDSPKNFLQMAQKIEYSVGLFIKKMFGLVGGAYVTPGPFSVYRREVFEKIGGFKQAHNSEDLEIAFRMQKNFMKIEQSHDAYSYTEVPESAKGLFRQRVRWVYGFLNNAWDYRKTLFRKKYGNFGIIVVPTMLFGTIAIIFTFSVWAYNLTVLLSDRILEWQVSGFQGLALNPDWYFLSTSARFFLISLSAVLSLSIVALGVKMAYGKARLPAQIIYYFFMVVAISPIWVAKAIVNVVFRQTPRWR